MNAKVTLQLNLTELDLLRTAVEVRLNQQRDRANDETVDAASRAKSRRESIQLNDLLHNLK